MKSISLIVAMLLLASPASSQDEVLMAGDVCWKDGRIFVADIGDQSVKEIDSSGKVITKHGRIGRGPGEYQKLASVFCGRSGVYALDSQSLRVTFYPYQNMAVPKTYAIEKMDLFQANIVETDGHIFLAGPISRTRKTVAMYDKDFNFIKYVGKELELVGANPYLVRGAWHQLAHTELALVGDKLLYVKPAPLEYYLFDPVADVNGADSIRHDLIGKPWEEGYIVVTENTYESRFYPQAHSVSGFGDRALVALAYGPHGDMRHEIYEFVDGKLIHKQGTGVGNYRISNVQMVDGMPKFVLYDADAGTLEIVAL